MVRLHALPDAGDGAVSALPTADPEKPSSSSMFFTTMMTMALIRRAFGISTFTFLQERIVSGK